MSYVVDFLLEEDALAGVTPRQLKDALKEAGVSGALLLSGDQLRIPVASARTITDAAATGHALLVGALPLTRERVVELCVRREHPRG